MDRIESLRNQIAATVAKQAEPEPWHIERYLQSFLWTESLLDKANLVLEAGGASAFGWLLSEIGYRVDATATDLRFPLEINNRYDLVYCMEVIEHVKDQDRADNLATYDESGIRQMLSSLLEVTTPGGHLFLSTPNVCHFWAVKRIFLGMHPYMYPPHQRELAPVDVLRLITDAGWQPVRHQCLDVWNSHGVTQRDKDTITRACQVICNNSGSLHGDCFFVLAQKPA